MISNFEREERNEGAYSFHASILPDLKKTILPLFHSTPLTQFCYMRFFEDGRYIMLCTHDTWYKFQFKYVRDNGIEFNLPLQSCNNKRFTKYVWPKDIKDSLIHNIKSHGMINGITVFMRGEKYVDSWTFSSNKSFENVNKFLFQNQLHFNDILMFSKQWIQEEVLDKNNISDIQATFDDPLPLQSLNSKKKLHKIPCYINGKIIYFSKREKECIYLLLRGYTSKQIAQSLFISPKTVDFYIDNIKTKSRCQYRSEITKLFAPFIC